MRDAGPGAIPRRNPPGEAELRSLSRRKVLRGAVLLVGGLLGAAAWPRLRSGPFPPPHRPLRHLDARQAGIVRALGLFLVGRDHGRVPVEEVVDGTLAALHPGDRRLWLAALEVFESTTFLVGGRLAPMSELPYDDGVAWLESWARSGSEVRRTLYMAVRRVVIASWYMDPRAWPTFGYEGPWVKRFQLPTVPLRYPLRDPVRR